MQERLPRHLPPEVEQTQDGRGDDGELQQGQPLLLQRETGSQRQQTGNDSSRKWRRPRTEKNRVERRAKCKQVKQKCAVTPDSQSFILFLSDQSLNSTATQVVKRSATQQRMRKSDLQMNKNTTRKASSVNPAQPHFDWPCRNRKRPISVASVAPAKFPPTPETSQTRPEVREPGTRDGDQYCCLHRVVSASSLKYDVRTSQQHHTCGEKTGCSAVTVLSETEAVLVVIQTGVHSFQIHNPHSKLCHRVRLSS